MRTPAKYCPKCMETRFFEDGKCVVCGESYEQLLGRNPNPPNYSSMSAKDAERGIEVGGYIPNNPQYCYPTDMKNVPKCGFADSMNEGVRKEMAKSLEDIFTDNSKRKRENVGWLASQFPDVSID